MWRPRTQANGILRVSGTSPAHMTHIGSFAVGITAGIVMIALGAILKFALPWTVLGVVNTAGVGVILMTVGALDSGSL